MNFTLDFMGEFIEFLRDDFAGLIENGDVVLDEFKPLIDVDTLIVRGVEERNHCEDFLRFNTAVFAVLLREGRVREFEGVGEEVLPKIESRRFVERREQIVMESRSLFRVVDRVVLSLHGFKSFQECFEFDVIVACEQVTIERV